ncbi:MAG: glycosyltransferase [Pyrinomonadaceae bacterium]|nr:glycosyltransferase [Pyrinomonadaceae bacterium]
MKEQPLVSVSLVTYNQQEFIRESIESVLNQDYDNLEIVIGDDGSQDNTWAIVQEYQRNYPDKIKAFRNEQNLGITGNCNEVLKRCAGKHIAFAAGDDVMLPGKISKQVEVMERDQSVVLCYHDVEAFNSEDGKTLRFRNHGPLSSPPITGDAEKVAREVIEQSTSFLAAVSIMARRDSLPATGFDPRIPTASDWLMWIEILAAGGPTKKVEYIPDVLVRYRRHGSNITLLEHCGDRLVTLAIVESKYPRFVFSVHKWYREFHYYCGLRMICNNELSAGRNVMLLSLRSGWVSWKIFYWLAASYLPSLLVLRRRKFPLT